MTQGYSCSFQTSDSLAASFAAARREWPSAADSGGGVGDAGVQQGVTDGDQPVATQGDAGGARAPHRLASALAGFRLQAE
jgi:hypothetical protein